LSIDTEITWAHPEDGVNQIALYDLYKINYSWPMNGTAAGHWDPDGGLNYTLTQPKYSRRRDMRGIVFTAGLAVRSYVTHRSHIRSQSGILEFIISKHILNDDSETTNHIPFA
jgi:hypothetical protein